jgi:hypothetical protein
MSSKVLGSGTDGDFGIVDFDAYGAPIGKGVEIDASLDQRLGELFSFSFEGVGSDGERTLGFVGLEELDHLGRVEEI